ncbi:MAG: EF-hand domain-containing protein [Thermoguttaceae bacterium]
MKKILSIAATITAAAASIAIAQQQDKAPAQPTLGRILVNARAENGQYDLSKILNNDRIPEETRKFIQEADKDKDGFLNREEAATLRAANAPGGNFPGGPQGFGGPQGGFGGPRTPFGEAFADGKLDLSKLPENLPEEVKTRFTSADKDGDGFLTVEEMQAMPRPKFQFSEGQKPDFINDDNAIVIEKLLVAIKKADTNEDGLIDTDELKTAAESIRENSPETPRFINNLFNSAQPGMFGMGMGMMGMGPRPDQGGPNAEGQPGPGRPNARQQGDARQQGNRQQGDARQQGNRQQGDARQPSNRQQRDARQQGNRQQGGPQGGPQGAPRMGMGFGGPELAAAMTNGKLRLSKLPKTISDERKAAFKAADKNKDGYLTMEEFQAMPEPKFEFEENKRPAFVDENNAFVCNKLEEALKAADKNTDGVIDDAEIQDFVKEVREASPSFQFFMMRSFGGFGRMGAGPMGQPGMGQPGMGGPGFGGPQGGPQGEQGQRTRGARQGNRASQE